MLLFYPEFSQSRNRKEEVRNRGYQETINYKRNVREAKETQAQETYSGE